MFAYAVLNTSDFSKQGYAEQALLDEGFTTGSTTNVYGLWRSRDGLVDAVIKERFRDGRFYIVFFA